MSYKKGVKSVELDMETKKLTITYRIDKTDPDILLQPFQRSDTMQMMWPLTPKLMPNYRLAVKKEARARSKELKKTKTPVVCFNRGFSKKTFYPARIKFVTVELT